MWCGVVWCGVMWCCCGETSMSKKLWRTSSVIVAVKTQQLFVCADAAPSVVDYADILCKDMSEAWHGFQAHSWNCGRQGAFLSISH
jgi:hypothetical protein